MIFFGVLAARFISINLVVVTYILLQKGKLAWCVSVAAPRCDDVDVYAKCACHWSSGIVRGHNCACALLAERLNDNW